MDTSDTRRRDGLRNPEVKEHLPHTRIQHALFILGGALIVGSIGWTQMRFVLHITPTWPLLMTPVVLGAVVSTLLLRTWRYKQAALSLLSIVQSRERALQAVNEALEHKNDQLRESADHALANADRKSRLVAQVSHEIRTPLGGILNMTQVLLHEESDPEREKALAILGRAGEMLLRIVNDVLDLSKADAPAFELDEAPFALVEAVEVIANLFAPIAANKGIRFEAEIDPGVPALVHGDPVRTTQILNNLVVNAIKFTERGVVRLHVAKLEGDSIRFEVTDTGIGVPERDRDRIFEPFAQLTGSMGAERGGTGLGLAISKRLAGLMGGRLALNSQVGRGSTFSFTVPLTEADGPEPRAPLLVKDPPTARASVMKVLVVEDDELLQAAYKMLLPRLGYEHYGALDGEQAIEMVRSEAFDLVLMDYHMPRLGGPEATRGIRNLPLGFGVPILGLTGVISAGERKDCLAAGMDEVLTKPICRADLSRALHHWSTHTHAAS